jgi:hypothetical protein
MEVIVVLGVLSFLIAAIAIKDDKKRQKSEYEQVLSLDLPEIAPVKKKIVKKAVKKAVKKKPVKKAAKKAVKKAIKKKPKTDKKKASVKK